MDAGTKNWTGNSILPFKLQFDQSCHIKEINGKKKSDCNRLLVVWPDLFVNVLKSRAACGAGVAEHFQIKWSTFDSGISSSHCLRIN